MRFATVATLPIAFAGAARAAQRKNPTQELEWDRYDWHNADWYKAHGTPLPQLAPPVTVVDRQSYIVKLECLGCPFRVQEPVQDNSLLLNLTIDASSPLESTLLLNGAPIAPYISLPQPISAFQAPANLSQGAMSMLVSHHTLSPPQQVNVKFGRFELQYMHSLLATQDPAEEWVQFDVMAVHRRGVSPSSTKLNDDGQKMVQILIRQDVGGNGKMLLSIKEIRVDQRKDRVQPLKMKCGKLAMIETEYNPLEWDSYGQFGTWSRPWHIFLSKSGEFMLHVAPLILLFLAAHCAARWFIRHIQNRRREQAQDDAESALLSSEYDDAPPEYVGDVEEMEHKEEKEDE